MISDARVRVARMDISLGGSEVDRLGRLPAVRSVMNALKSGIETGEWRAIADAYVMLEQIEAALRVMP